jgi:hypothetical protein
MEAVLVERNQAQDTGEEKLWRAVIANTVREWIHGPLRRRREAEQYLFHNTEDYKTVCYSAGINPWDLRERLQRIRERVKSEARATEPQKLNVAVAVEQV